MIGNKVALRRTQPPLVAGSTEDGDAVVGRLKRYEAVGFGLPWYEDSGHCGSWRAIDRGGPI